MREIEITSDAEVLSATIFDSTATRAVLVIASATGVKQSFYKRFAAYISSQNITVITFDYYGIGRSLKKPIKELTNNAEDWGKNDLESVINYAINNYPNSRKILLGHSIGGQLVGLAKSATKLDKIILVATQSGYWKFWKGTARLKMWMNWNIIFPTLLNLFGYLPSKRISGMEDLPKNVAKQWSGWCKKSEYLFNQLAIEGTVFDKIGANITSFSIEDDYFAPKKAVDWMTEMYSSAKIKRVHLLPQDFNTQKIGHFGVFGEKFRDSLWQLLLNETK